MVAEPWILKMGNQVGNNLKQALYLDNPSKKKNNNSNKRTCEHKEKETIGILSFEVANVMSKTIHLHKSLTDQEVTRLKNEILKSEGVTNLVSTDESYLLELVLSEKLDDLNHVASVISRLGKRCTEPPLQGFEHVYADIMTGVIDVRGLRFLVKDMEGMIRKMERYVTATSNLYNEMQVLSELEQASKKFQQNQHEETRRAFEQKLIWQGQDVRHLRDISLWNQTYDKIIGLLARTICTIYARICLVFGDSVLKLEFHGLPVLGSEFSSRRGRSSPFQNENEQISGNIATHRSHMASGPLRPVSTKSKGYHSGQIERVPVDRRGQTTRSGPIMQRSPVASFRPEYLSVPCGAIPARLLMECLSLSTSATSMRDDGDHECQSNQGSSCVDAVNGLKREQPYHSGCFSPTDTSVPFSGDLRQTRSSISSSKSQFVPKSRLTVRAPPSTVGGSALALHYANVIIVIEKLLRYPHLVGDEARDDLYQMLPTSLRKSLRTNLRSYMKNLAIYDAPLAHDWKETLDKILKWFAPLAHNMIRWQTERNLEQQQIVTRTNVLLLQTLYFADREKTEGTICQLLVGLNYICRYEHQQNALLDCASSFDFDDCVEWRWQEPLL